MRKFLFIFVLFFTFTSIVNAKTNFINSSNNVLTNSVDTVYHDGKAVINTVYKDGKAVIDSVYQDGKFAFKTIYPDVKNAINQIAKGIGVVAEHLYEILVRKYFVLGITEALFFVLSLLAFIISCVWWNKSTSGNKQINYRVIFPAVLFIFSIIMLFNINYTDMVMGIVNPEYGAVDYILNFTKGYLN